MNSMMTLKCVISVDGPKPCVIPFMWYFDEGKPSVQKRAGGCLQMAVGGEEVAGLRAAHQKGPRSLPGGDSATENVIFSLEHQPVPRREKPHAAHWVLGRVELLW